MLEHLCVAYPRPYYTKKQALYSFGISAPYCHQYYIDNVIWLQAHTQKAWIWYQPHPYDPGYIKYNWGKNK